MKRTAPQSPGVSWHMTITSRDGRRLVFHGSSPDRAEIERLAAWAHQQQPALPILIRPPAGPVYAWGAQK